MSERTIGDTLDAMLRLAERITSEPPECDGE